ncbi:MAG: hypothetical protein LBJ70_00945, partial [Holosporales bacterium]|nr:hypothetical protein [Holosporales bacterium]
MTASLSREELCSIMERVQVAALVIHGKVGSVFLHGLFDQHEEVATAPVPWVYDFYSHDHAVLSPETYLDLVVRNTMFKWSDSDLFNLKGCYALEEAHEIGREAFCSLFFSLCQTYGTCKRKEYFLLFHIALFLLRGRKIENLKLILVHLHWASGSVFTERNPQGGRVSYLRDPEKISQDFQKIRFVNLVRNPIHEMESMRGEHRYAPHMLVLLLMHRVLCWNQVYFTLSSGCPVFVLKTPDLHHHFDAVMKALSAFLGITYNPSLRESTFWGNAVVIPGKQKVLTNGPNPDFIDYKGLLSGYEISIPRFFLRVPLAKFFPEAV